MSLFDSLSSPLPIKVDLNYEALLHAIVCRIESKNLNDRLSAKKHTERPYISHNLAT